MGLYQKRIMVRTIDVSTILLCTHAGAGQSEEAATSTAG